MSRRSRLALFLVLSALGAVAPAAHAAKPVPGAVYVGSTANGGNVSLTVARNGNAFYSLRARSVPGSCEGEPSTIQTTVERVRVSPRGRFRDSTQNSEAYSVSGGFLRGGRVSGRLGYFDRGGCAFSQRFTARAQPRARGRGRVFRLVGGPFLLGSSAPDGTPATDSGLGFGTNGIAARSDGSLLMASGSVRAIGVDGRLSTVPGTRGLAATSVEVAPDGSLLVAEALRGCVRRVAQNATNTVVAGRCGAETGFSGDGGPATAAQLGFPNAVSAAADGSFLIADQSNNRIRRVSADGTISTVAGNSTFGSHGDGGPATAAGFNVPTDVEVLPDGSFLVADSGNGRIRKVDAGGVVSTVAGRGRGDDLDPSTLPSGFGFSGDRGPATRALLDSPNGIVATADGGFLIADSGAGRVRRVDAGGTITTIAGGGEISLGGPPLLTDLGFPFSLAITPEGIAVGGSNGIDQILTGPTERLFAGFVQLTGGSGLPPATRPRDTLGRARFRSSRRARPKLRVALNRTATVTIEALKGDRVARRYRRRLGAGDRHPRLARPLPRGRYALILTARSGSRIARSRALLEVR